MDSREWQPIETAPKDGTPVIVFWPDFGGDLDVGLRPYPLVAEAFWGKPATWTAEHWTIAGQWTPDQPTHWMPLPLPPGDTSSG